MDSTSKDNTPADHHLHLIEAGQREAAELADALGPPKPPPDAVPGYEIVGEIGRGGMGVIYRALQLSTKRVVALKVMLGGSFASRSTRKRFKREVELAARLQHPGIVRILESDLLPSGQQYFAMDYVEGVTLDRYVTMARPDLRTMLGFFAALCEAVDHAHQHGVIHRDLKPTNVIVDREGRPHILDFGLAKATDRVDTGSLDTLVSSPGQLVGTLRYLSPEQAAGEPDEIDTRTDVYALGVMLFECLTGSLPFNTRGHFSKIVQSILEEPPPRPSSLSDQVDGEVETIILKAMEKDKFCRYRSSRELGEDIRRYLDDEPIRARPPSSLYILRKKLVKHRLRLAVAVLALFLGLGGIWGGTWWRDRALVRQQEHARADARKSLLILQCRLEEGVRRTEDLLAESQHFLLEHPALPEAILVCAQARYAVARQRGDESITGLAMAVLEGTSARQDRFHWAYSALLAEFYDKAKDPRAVQLRDECERQAPDTAEAWYIRSFATLDVHRALDCTEQALKRDPAHRFARERRASLCQQTGDTKGALKAAEALIDLGGARTHWLLFQGGVLLRHKRYEEAVERYTLAIQGEPGWQAHRCRALAYLCLREYDKAVADFTKAVELHGEYEVWDRYHRATPLWMTGRTDEAIGDYRAFRQWRGFPTFADARLFLILQGQGRREQADHALAVVRDTVQDKWLIKVLACLAGDITPNAIVEIAGSADPPSRERLCEAYYYAGEACLLKERSDEAREWLRKCVDMDLPFDPDNEYLDPMNEYHLAVWRLDDSTMQQTQGAATSASSRE